MSDNSKLYYGFIQNSRMNYCAVPYSKFVEEIVFGIYVKNDGCISEAAMVWEKTGSEVIPYFRVFCDGITAFYSEKFKEVATEISNQENITPKQFAELLLKHGFKDISDKPLIA